MWGGVGGGGVKVMRPAVSYQIYLLNDETNEMEMVLWVGGLETDRAKAGGGGGCGGVVPVELS